MLEFATAAAAQAAALHAHREVAAQYARALRFAAGLPDAERARLLEARSVECYLSDQGPAAIAARRTALDLRRRSGDRLREGENLRWLSPLSWFEGRNAEAEATPDGSQPAARSPVLAPGPSDASKAAVGR